MKVTFEFGETEASKAFFNRNAKFCSQFERLMTLGNKCFGREIKPKNRPEDICFGLGHTCRDDFLEIVFLAVNGYGNGASKLLRGLYERAVALAYIVKRPEKAERFMKFAAIQEHRGLVAALKVVTEAEFDKVMKSPQTAAETRQRYRMVKPEFKRTVSWDEKDLASMVDDLGDPYDKLYLSSYAIPNFSIHATLASAMRYESNTTSEEVRLDKERQEAEFALVNAILIFTLVIQTQNTLFALNLDEDIEACHKDIAEVWIAS